MGNNFDDSLGSVKFAQFGNYSFHIYDERGAQHNGPHFHVKFKGKDDLLSVDLETGKPYAMTNRKETREALKCVRIYYKDPVRVADAKQLWENLNPRRQSENS